MFLEIVRALYGMLELRSPEVVAGAALGKEPDERLRVTIRILGARHIAQALLTVITRGRLHRAGGVVDLLHASTMLGLAVVDRRRRRAALTSAAIATLFAAGELR